MFSNNYGNYGIYGNTIPTGTQPYGYPVSPYMNMSQQNQMQQQAQQQMPTTNTNKVYVNGVEDVRNRLLPPNSDFIFLDNDKAILYQKIVDPNGKFEVKAFSISPYEPQESQKQDNTIDLSGYVKTGDLDPIKNEIQELKEKLNAKKVEVSNGSRTNVGSSNGTTISTTTKQI